MLLSLGIASFHSDRPSDLVITHVAVLEEPAAAPAQRLSLLTVPCHSKVVRDVLGVFLGATRCSKCMHVYIYIYCKNICIHICMY